MLMNQIRQNIFLLTKRPDQVPMTDLAIKSALQRIHNVGNLERDMKFETITRANKATVKTFDLPKDYRKTEEVFVNFGDNRYLYGEGKMVMCTPNRVREFLANGKDCYHIVGKQINCFSVCPFDSIVVKYYKRCILDTVYIQEDWIIDDYNEMFTNLAASIVFSNLRNYEAAQSFLSQYALGLQGFLLQELEDGNATEMSSGDDSWVGNHG